MNQLISTFKDDFQSEHAIPVGSGTTGIALILSAINAKHKKVIIPAMTCPNVAIAVHAAGAVPLVVDVSCSDANISIEAIQSAMDNDTAAIIAVDSFGYPANIPQIEEIADRYQCIVIEDACQAYGGITDKKPIGGRGTAGVISFGFVKPIDSGAGGGMVLTDDRMIAERILQELKKKEYFIFSQLKNKITLGLMLKEKNRLLKQLAGYGFYKFRFPKKTVSRVAVLWARLKQNRQKLIETLRNISDLLKGLPGVEPFEYTFDGWLPWRLSIKVPDDDRKSYLIEKLKESGIRFSHLYQPLPLQIPALKTHGTLNNTNLISQRIINFKYTMDVKDITALKDKLRRLKRIV